MFAIFYSQFYYHVQRILVFVSQNIKTNIPAILQTQKCQYQGTLAISANAFMIIVFRPIQMIGMAMYVEALFQEMVSAAEKFHQTAKLLTKFINSVNESLKVYAKSNKDVRKEQKDLDDRIQKINEQSNQESHCNSQKDKMGCSKDVLGIQNARVKEDKRLQERAQDGKMDVQGYSNNIYTNSGERRPLLIEGKALQKSSFNLMSTAAKLSYNHLTNLQSNLMPKKTRKDNSAPIKIPQKIDNPKKEKQNNETNQNVFKVEMKNFLKLSARHVGIAYNTHIQNMKATYDPTLWKEKLEPIPIKLRKIKKDKKAKGTK